MVIVAVGALGSSAPLTWLGDGHDVSLIAFGERARALATHCVSVQGAETFSVRCDIVTEPKRLHSTNPLFATKIYDTRTAIDARAQGRKAFCMQNGVLEAFSTAWRPVWTLDRVAPATARRAR